MLGDGATGASGTTGASGPYRGLRTSSWHRGCNWCLRSSNWRRGCRWRLGFSRHHRRIADGNGIGTSTHFAKQRRKVGALSRRDTPDFTSQLQGATRGGGLVRVRKESIREGHTQSRPAHSAPSIGNDWTWQTRGHHQLRHKLA
jgi:hypothetical protein